MGSGCCYCKHSKDFINKYLYPKKDVKEMILILNKDHTLGLLDVKDSVLCLNADASYLMTSIFADLESKSIYELIKDDEDMHVLISELVKDDIFEIIDYNPKKDEMYRNSIKSGDVINKESDLKHVKAEYDGNIRKIKMNDVSIYVYEGNEDIEAHSSIESCIVKNKSTQDCTVYPKHLSNLENIKPQAMRSGKTACGACGTCGVCAACAFCAEINFAVAAAYGTAGLITTQFQV